MSDCSSFFQCKIGGGIYLWVLVACGILLMCICCICLLIGFFLWRRHHLHSVVDEHAQHTTVKSGTKNQSSSMIVDVKPTVTDQTNIINKSNNNYNNGYSNNGHNSGNLNNGQNNTHNNNINNNYNYDNPYNSHNGYHDHIQQNIPSTDLSNNNPAYNKITPNSRSGISRENELNYSSSQQQQLMNKKYNEYQNNFNDNTKQSNNKPDKTLKFKLQNENNEEIDIKPPKRNKKKKGNRNKKRVKNQAKAKPRINQVNRNDNDSDSAKTKNTELTNDDRIEEGDSSTSEESDSSSEETDDGMGTGGTGTGTTGGTTGAPNYARNNNNNGRIGGGY